MKKNNLFLLVGILMLVFVVPVKAQNPEAITGAAKVPKKTPIQKATSLTDTLNKAVTLSKDQYSKAYAIHLDYEVQKEAFKNDSTLDYQASREKIELASQKRKMDIEALLTPEQVLKWKAWKEAKKAEKNKQE